MKLLDEHSLRAIKNLVRTGPKDDKDAKYCEQVALAVGVLTQFFRRCGSLNFGTGLRFRIVLAERAGLGPSSVSHHQVKRNAWLRCIESSFAIARVGQYCP